MIPTFVKSFMVPSSIGCFSVATMGESSSTALREGRAGARSVNTSSDAWLTYEKRGDILISAQLPPLRGHF